MENDSPNQTTKRLLIHISKAAKFTDPDFAITACNQAAWALFLYNQESISGHFSFLVSPVANTNSHLSLVNTTLLNVRETEHINVRGIGTELPLSWLHGRFEINSKPGEGATIIVTASRRLNNSKNLLKNNPNYESTGC